MTFVATGIGVCCAVGLNMAAVLVQTTQPPPTDPISKHGDVIKQEFVDV